MQFEIEVKAWVDDAPALERVLREKTLFCREYLKNDRYYRFGANKPDVRVRQDGVKYYLTWKEKNLVAGVEINREHETLIDNPSAIETLLEVLGAEFLVEKRKTGTAWELDGILIEFSEIASLGYFVEIEATAPETADMDARNQLKEQILSVLDVLEISRDRIESRSYTRMLLEKSQDPSASALRYS